jgi:6-pyruvoyltetrahydropterin/6-carboxytetrahydropterin synthase
MHGQALISVRHNFETAHRLPFLEGKCQSIHGHTWWAEVQLQRYDVYQGITNEGISVDYGTVKKVVRRFIDTYLDHGTMLGKDDSLLTLLADDGTKLFVFGEPPEVLQSTSWVAWWDGLPWPTVEAVAAMLCDELQGTFDDIYKESKVKIWVEKVTVSEGPVNSATWVQTLGKEEDK